MLLKYRNVLFLFFVSGFTALVFEVVWAKQACLIFGNTTLASASVIAAFMTGLAIGSHFFGKLADRRPESGLKLYACLEAGIALFALVFPLIIRLLHPVYESIYLRFHHDFLTISVIRFAMSFLVLIVPTTLMGGTLPLLSRYLSRDDASMKDNLSRLYAMNLFGAMAGTFASGFILLANLGIWLTSIAAAAVNLGLFAYVMRAERGAAAPAPATETISETPADAPLPQSTFLFILALMVVHGFVAFVVQICWTRTMALILGSSTYAFSAMLTTFLAGLGLGSWAVSKFAARRVPFTLASLGFLEIAVGLSVLFFIPVFEWIVFYYVLAFPIITISTFTAFTAQFFFSAMAMIVPTFLMGTVFPATLYYVGRPKNIGRVVGATYAANTLGGVAGSFVGAFFFIGSIGLNGTLQLVSVFSIVTGAALVWKGTQRPNFKLNAGKTLVAFALAAVFLLYPWNREIFSSGVFLYASTWTRAALGGKQSFERALASNHKLVYYKDGISSTVTVIQYNSPSAPNNELPSKSLRVNGKTDASTIGDMATQLYSGYIPMFAHPNPENVLVIGLGSGVTLGAVTQFKSVKAVEMVEIEPAVVEANRYFATENNFALKDPRVKVVIGDGRNHIAFTKNTYDVIISEPSNPWISGISNLFSTENYELAKKKLSDDGLYLQWLQSYQMSLEDFLMVAKTFSSSFPHTEMYRVNDSDYLLLGSKKPLTFDYGRMMRLIRENPSTRSDIEYFSPHAEHFVLGSFMLSDRDLRAALAAFPGRIRLNTDDRLRLEYNAPKHLYKATSEDISKWLYSLKRQDPFPEFTGWTREKILGSPHIWNIYYRHGMDAYAAQNYDRALDDFREARRLAPREPRIPYAIGLTYDAQGHYRRAIREYARIRPSTPFKRKIGSGFRRAKLRIRLQQNPILQRDVEWHNTIAGLSFQMGDVVTAVDALKKAIDLNPMYAKNYSDMARFALAEGREAEALDLLESAARINPEDTSFLEARQMYVDVQLRRRILALLRMGRDKFKAREYGAARAYFQKIVEVDPENGVAHALLAECADKTGLKELASKHAAIANDLRQQVLESQGAQTEPSAT